jgi:hypothetical protein
LNWFLINVNSTGANNHSARGAAQTAKLSQRRTSKKQKVLQRSNPFVSETFVSFGLLAGAPALERGCRFTDWARGENAFSENGSHRLQAFKD